MSMMGAALGNWLNRHYSIMHQEPTVCDRFPENTRDEMWDISMESARTGWVAGVFTPAKLREKGAPITKDYILGTVRTGSRDRVLIPRPEGTIGTYHTHPFGSPFPSITDAYEVIKHDDRVACIGATGKPGTKIQCFTPNKPKWDEIQYKFRLLVDDIKDYNEKLGIKYKQRGTSLQKLLEGVGSPVYLEKIEYVTPEELEEEAVKAERAAKGAEETFKVAEVQADRATEAVKVARAELDKAVTEEEIREASMNVRMKEEEARHATARVGIERELAKNARIAAGEAAFRAKMLALGKAQAVAANRDATEHLREGANLARRRDSLESEIRTQLRELAAPEEWKALKWTDGFSELPFFEVYPNMFSKCRLLWEELEEELPVEL